MSTSQELALGLIISILVFKWLVPSKGQSTSKLQRIINAAWTGQVPTSQEAASTANPLAKGPFSSTAGQPTYGVAPGQLNPVNPIGGLTGT